MEFTAEQIAEFVGGVVEGDGDAIINNISKIDDSKEGTISFLANETYGKYLYDTKASVVLINSDFKLEREVKCTLIRVENSYTAVATLLNMYSEMQPKKVGIEEPSFISKSAKIGTKVYIGAFAYIGSDVTLGDNVKIYPNAYIGDNVVIGDNTVVYSGVSIYSNCTVGSDTIIHSGAVIGSDGFGHAPQPDGSYIKIAQMGNVVIGDRVEVGANTTIDCATMGSTVVESGVKLDNLVMIAHNVSVGENTVMAAQSGIAGSAKVGKRCVFGGQSAINGHITVGNDVHAGGKTGIMGDLPDGAPAQFGAPSTPVKDALRVIATQRRLPQMRSDIGDLKKRIAQLEKLLDTK